tara:strand:- start:11702 stop:12484 length:783 start_codon:yes stop_codon:yes gene_type:complete
MGNVHIWILILTWHVLATIIIYIFSVILKNSSLYDPFWSVAPVPIVLFLSIQMDTLEIKLLVLIPICIWAIRLTRNWIVSWQGFKHEDFRYVDLKNTNKFQAELTNFFGIHLIPTLIVNLGLFPLVYFVHSLSSSISIPLLYAASLFTLIAVILETVADEQMRKFRNNSNNKGKTMRFKLWKYSRHPNYLGEVLFWYGIYFMSLSTGILPIWTLICPTAMLALFIFISCPMMDERSLKNRSDYREYMDKTSQLFLLPPKS